MRKTSIAILFALLAGTNSRAQERPLAFDQGWKLEDKDTKVETFMGRSALRMRTGGAIRRDIRFQDGTIELDLLTTGDRSFVFVDFRMAQDDEYEEIYFRPHKSHLPDALQYTPVYRGEGNWQLYHGEGATGFADFPRNEWVHVKIVVSGSQAAVFVGDASKPQLLVPRLAREPASGPIALRSFLPGGKPEGIYPTSIANVVVRPGQVDTDFPPPETEAPPAKGTIWRWAFSEPYPTPEGLVRALPAGWKESRWREVKSEGSTGLVVIGKTFDRPVKNRRATILAKLTLTSEEDQRVPIHLGYSDEVTVFLDGAPLFSADDSYSFDRPRRDGLIEPDQAIVVLPLRRGQNQLVLAVTDVFGGWGLMGRIEGSGVAVSTR